MAHAKTRRRGVTLLELLVVVTLLGIFASVVMARVGKSLLANRGAQADVRRLALDLLQMQRRTITTGRFHGIVFTTGAGGISGYRVVENLVAVPGGYDTDGSTTDVDNPRTFTEDVDVSVSHTEMGFNFEGQAGAAYQVSLQGPDRGWQITVIPITGAVSVTEINW